MKTLAAIAGGLFALAMPPQKAAVPDRALTVREKLWHDIEPLPEAVFRIDKAASLYRSTAGRYQRVESMRVPGCPAPVVFALHMRESTWSFAKHLHEGSPLTARTRWVPKGRPLTGKPPYSWETSAEDALYILKKYQAPAKWQSIDSMVDWIERYNGLGYRTYHPTVPSPYLVAGSNLQRPGKYVADGKFSRTEMDRQLGCLTVLKEIARRGDFAPPPY